MRRAALDLPEHDPFEELAHIGDVQLPRTGKIVRVRVMPDPEHGPGIDLREFRLPSYWDKVNAARAKAASSGQAIRGAPHPEQYTGPLRKGWRLGPGAAEELAELLALAVVKAESIAATDSQVSGSTGPLKSALG